MLWRGYPVDLRATFFQRFWPYVDPSRVDIDPLADWKRSESIAAGLPQGTEAMTVFVVRGDVVRRYPMAHYFLQKARLGRDDEIRPVADQVQAATVRGALDRDTLFVGFAKSPDEVIGDRAGGDPGWLLAIEEQPAAPRFGLDDVPDPPDYHQAPATWAALSWANVAAGEKALADLTHAPVDVDWLDLRADRGHHLGPERRAHGPRLPAVAVSHLLPRGSARLAMPKPRRTRTSDPPPGGSSTPDEPVNFGAAFRVLDRRVPLALLPLRLEVRFWTASTPPELRVRIFPDAIHADAHRAALTATEQALGVAYWRRCWRAGPAPPFTGAHDAAFAWLAGQIGPWRAAWVVRDHRLNLEQAPPRPLPEAAPLQPPPRFPGSAKPRTAGGPAYARLLPSRFALVVVDDTSVVGTWWGAEVADDLALAPGLVEADGDLDGRALLDAQGLTWTYDFEAAVDAGMAIRVDFSTLPAAFLRRGFSQLLVLGVRTTDQRAELEALLTAHRYTDGLDFIGQGTPTNVTESAEPGISLERPDLAAVRASELGPDKDRPLPSRGAGRTLDLPRPVVTGDGDLYRMTAAHAATAALGLAGDGALDRATNERLEELPHAEAMAQALWPGLSGHYLDAVMQLGLSTSDRAWLRDWSARYVRGAGRVHAAGRRAALRPASGQPHRRALRAHRPCRARRADARIPGGDLARRRAGAAAAGPRSRRRGARRRGAGGARLEGPGQRAAPDRVLPAARHRRAGRLHHEMGRDPVLDPARRRRRALLGRQHGHDRDAPLRLA